MTSHLSEFLPFIVDPELRTVRMMVPDGVTELYLLCQLGTGLGSSALSLDRGMQGKVRMARFERDGRWVQLVQLNKAFRVRSTEPAAAQVGAESFLTSVIFNGVVDDDGAVDVTEFVVSDHVGVAAHFAEQGQGSFTLDRAASHVIPGRTSQYPDRVEFTVQTTFSGGSAGARLAEVAPSSQRVTLTQRLSVIPVPAGFRPRVFHPRSGGYGKGFADSGVTAGASPQVRYQPRFRLESVGSNSRSSTVKRPIVFWVDPGIEEPWRTAVLQGGSWWADAFRAAGLVDAFRVMVRPPHVDPLDSDVTNLWWVHRSGRGWSRAAASTDPMTGEILRANVRLGSQRVHQVTQLAETLLAPYGKQNEADLLIQISEFVQARVRALAAHEIGHAIGFMHNYASTGHPSPSVMDYPHPRIQMGPDGEVDLSDAYITGLGIWDYFTVHHAYGCFNADEEPAALAELRRQTKDQGLAYVTDADGAAPSASHPDGVPWTMGADPFAGLRALLEVRRHALEHFGPGVLAPDRDAGELTERLTTAYLLHRHELTAVARLIGGVRYDSGWASDTAIAPSPVDGATQRRALQALAALLAPEVLTIPAATLACINPVGIRYRAIPEYLIGRTGPTFDPLEAAEVAATLVVTALWEPARLNRVAWQHASDPTVPPVWELIQTGLQAALAESLKGSKALDTLTADRPVKRTDALVRSAAGWLVLDRALATLAAPELHAPVAEQIRKSLVRLAEDWALKSDSELPSMARRIHSYLSDPRSVTLCEQPPIPPGMPI